MTDLVAFLKARLDELQGVAETVTEWPAQGWDPPVWVQDDDYKHNTLVVDKMWLLADVAAKRKIIEFWSQAYSKPADFSGLEFDQVRRNARWTLWQLAQPYAGHPDFDESWKA